MAVENIIPEDRIVSNSLAARITKTSDIFDYIWEKYGYMSIPKKCDLFHKTGLGSYWLYCTYSGCKNKCKLWKRYIKAMAEVRL